MLLTFTILFIPLVTFFVVSVNVTVESILSEKLMLSTGLVSKILRDVDFAIGSHLLKPQTYTSKDVIDCFRSIKRYLSSSLCVHLLKTFKQIFCRLLCLVLFRSSELDEQLRLCGDATNYLDLPNVGVVSL